jgi:hypothetical protein
LRHFHQDLLMVPSQTTFWYRNENLEVVLNWLSGFAWNLVKESHLILPICHKNFIAFGQVQMVLPSQHFPLDRNLEKF